MARQDRHHQGRPGLTSSSRRTALLGAVGAAAGVVGVVLYDPSRRHLVGCPFHRVTGLDCPGCGGTRAVDLLAHGDVVAALRSNAVALLAGVWLVGWWVHAVWPSATPWLAGWATPLRERSPAVLRTVGALVLVWAVARNLPGPDRWLAPV